MPLRPRLIERLLLFHFNLVPGGMLDFLGAEAFRAFGAARRLGVFDALTGGPLSAADIARRIDADARGTALLLQALGAVGYITHKNGRYAITAETAKWLPVLGDGLAFFEILLDRLGDLEQTVRRGGPAIDFRDWLDRRPNGWRDFQAGMVALARMAAREVAAKVDLPRAARRLLDVGGGHGLWAATLCRRYPQLSATVFDLPQALESARETIAEQQMEGRVAMQPGDFWKDDLGGGYDVALVFNIVHGNSADKNSELLRKVAGALQRGGRIVILDQLAGPVLGATARAAAALTGLALFNLTGGQAYSFDEIAGWLRSTGFDRPRRARLLRLPGSALVLATKVG